MKFAIKLPGRRSGPFEDDTATPESEAAEGSRLPRLFGRRRLIRIVALVAVAAAAGQVLQSFTRAAPPPQEIAAAPSTVLEVKPTALEPVAAQVATAPAPAAPLPTVEVAIAALTPAAPLGKEEMKAETANLLALLGAAPVPPAAGDPGLMITAQTPVLASTTAETTPALVPSAPAPAIAEASCPVTLDLDAAPGAMIKVTLLAPCAPHARVVLHHGGLSVTGMTTATGALFAALPALTGAASLEAVLPGGITASASLDLPDAARFRRFAVQWQGEDAFQINAYQDGAAFGTEGHIYGLAPGLAGDAGGYLQRLGDPAAPSPLLAEVYTYPVGELPVTLVVESAVTGATCGRELIAETLSARDGEVLITDLTLAMPDCGAIGDFLVLNNLDLDMTLAAN